MSEVPVSRLPRARSRRKRYRVLVVGSVGLALALTATACSGSDPTETGSDDPVGTSTTAGPSCGTNIEDCALRLVAEDADVLIGAAVNPEYLQDAAYAETLASEFNSVTPEIHLKWDFLHPEPDRYDFESADELVDFALANGMAVKGHTLVWDQEFIDSTPEWVASIDDPDELEATLRDHISTVMKHFEGRVDRWDVVNEPLEIRLCVERRGEDLHFAFKGSSPPCARPINSVRAPPLASVYLAIRHVFPALPLSSGAFGPLPVAGLEASGRAACRESG